MATIAVSNVLFCVLLLTIFTTINCDKQTSTFTPNYSRANAKNFNLFARSNTSAVYLVETDGTNKYEKPIYFIDLHGSRHQMGYDYGAMLGKEIIASYNSGTGKYFPRFNPEARLELLAIEAFADWQWGFLSRQITPEFIEEIEGIKAGAIAVGHEKAYKIIKRIIVLANLPSDISDLIYVLQTEYEDWLRSHITEYQQEAEVAVLPKDNPVTAELLLSTLSNILSPERTAAFESFQCSMYAVWGSRTANSDLYSCRNLDYGGDNGVNHWKSVTVWHPEGKNAHAAMGYVLLYGVLAGMSEKSISVHEANLEEDKDTFLGFPWILRLRYIMENANNLAQAKLLWEKTNNTVGYNHMIASALEAAPNSHPALALETMANYTAYFYDNDPRERNASVFNPSTGALFARGLAMPEALWRTNHGYDSETLKHYMWYDYNAGWWSVQRYYYGHDAFTYYRQQNIPIAIEQAINITAILGDKGHHKDNNPYVCENNNDGSNILSVTFQPKAQQFHAAWDNGSDANWRPACCNTYVMFDMSKWW